MVEPSARYEEVKIPLREPVHGLTEVSCVLGIPEWWPTGSRVAIALAHGSTDDMNDPLVTYLQRELTERKYMTLRFNFPFAEAGKRAVSDSMETLEGTYRAAIAILGRDPTAAPAHLFLAGKGLGGRVAGEIATSRVRIEGVAFLGYPLHPRDSPEKARADHLYRIIAPMLFVQGTRDRRCDVDTLRKTLSRVGAPITLLVCEEADENFHVPKRSEHTDEETRQRILEGIASWTERVLSGS